MIARDAQGRLTEYHIYGGDVITDEHLRNRQKFFAELMIERSKNPHAPLINLVALAAETMGVLSPESA